MRKEGKFTNGVPAPPISAVSQSSCLIALVAFSAVALALKYGLSADPFVGFLVLLGSISLLCLALEADQLKTVCSRAASAVTSGERVMRISIKLLGLCATFALIAAAYWAFPYYRSGNAGVLLRILNLVGLPLAVVTPVYVWVVDRSMRDPEDGLYMAGLLALGRWDVIDWPMLRAYALGWVVKAFFLPFMLEGAYRNWAWFHQADLAAVVRRHPAAWYDLAYHIIYSIDLIWASAGYFLTLRLFGTHIRSTDPTLGGWLACLLCYPPFSGVVGAYFLKFDDGFYWGHWLDDNMVLKQIWAVAIVGLLAIYCWATISFGGRFSNLTHRGIITNGPYRWVKHPAYITKNLSWWLISVPFVSLGEPMESLRLCLLLLGLNAIYYWRAQSEERHLAGDPKYVAYSLWIEEHGALARVRKTVRYLRG